MVFVVSLVMMVRCVAASQAFGTVKVLLRVYRPLRAATHSVSRRIVCQVAQRTCGRVEG
jgi:hypothetical protein